MIPAGNYIPGTQTDVPTGSSEIDNIIRRYVKAHRRRDKWLPRWQDCYDLALPNRAGFYQPNVGESRSDLIFDSTAVHSTQNFASRVKSYTTPNFAHWSQLRAGSEIPKDQHNEVNLVLDEVNEHIFDTIQNGSNFDQEDHEANIDLAVGTGALLCEEGDLDNLISFRAVPLPELILDGGPFSAIDHVYWPRKIKVSEIPQIYPRADLSKEIEDDIKSTPDREITVISCTLRDRARTTKDEAYDYRVISLEHQHILVRDRFEGAGSSPWIIFRWSTSSSEVYGRGPLLNALADIKVANLVVELILENAETSIVGMWQYDDDTIINPHTVQMVSGTMIPVSAGGAGIRPLTPGGSFDVAQIILEDLQNKIRLSLFDQPLGGLEQPVRSATEISERMAEFSRQTGSPFGRIQTEKTQPIMKRVAYILKKGGRISLPAINGREVRAHPVSPLGRAQEQQDIMNVDRWLEQLNMRFGPQMANLMAEQEEIGKFLAEKWGVPEKLVRTDASRQELTQQMAGMAEQAVAEGVPPDQIAKMAQTV